MPHPIILPYKGTFPILHPAAFVARGAAVIGDVVLGEDSSIWYNCTVRGDVHEIRIGKRTNIQDGTVVHVTAGKFGTYIGDDITVGHGAILHACTLQDRSFVGMGATVMDGVTVETDAMVAAGALVTPGKTVKSGELWGGSPARKLRDLRPEEIEYFPQSARHYVEIARGHRESVS